MGTKTKLVATGKDVKILHYKKCTNFRQLFVQSPELQPCRDALAEAKVSMDLTDAELGRRGTKKKEEEGFQEIVIGLINEIYVVHSSSSATCILHGCILAHIIEHDLANKNW